MTGEVNSLDTQWLMRILSKRTESISDLFAMVSNPGSQLTNSTKALFTEGTLSKDILFRSVISKRFHSVPICRTMQMQHQTFLIS